MNRRMLIYALGVLLLVEGILLFLPLVVSLIYRDGCAWAFLATIGIVAAVSGACIAFAHPRTKTIYAREGFAICAFGWIFLSLAGALPFFMTRQIPGYLDAVFETVSGFTTTGASILSDVEILSKSLLFWRSFTHWVGGMGVLVFAIAAFPLAGGGGNIYLMRAESPGPDVSKFVPSMRGTAMILYEIYFFMTLVEILLLSVFGGVPLFDALCISFGTAGTGGFAILNTSLATYGVFAQSVVTLFMILFGVNFSCYFLLLTRRFRAFFGNEELRLYVGILLFSMLVIAFNIRRYYASFGESLRNAAFQVASVMTTTGFTTVDFNTWPELSRMIMILIMCVGACVGSTGGGIKVSRILLLYRSVKRDIRKLIRPNSVQVVRFCGKPVEEALLRSTGTFFATYMMVFVLSLLVVSLDTKDPISNISGVVATLNNIGPGLEVVGATGNYGTYSALSKCVFISDMLLGRLEMFPLLVVLTPRLWRR